MAYKYLHLDLTVFIYPKNGNFTEENLDEIIAAAKDRPFLQDMTEDAGGRGFSFPQTEGVKDWQRWHCREQYGTADIRMNGPRHFAGMDGSAYPFVFRNGNAAVPNVIHLTPKYGPTIEQMDALVHLFQELGHTVIASEGYDFIRKKFKYGQSRTYYINAPQARRMGLPV
jgi:hypothetical protein